MREIVENTTVDFIIVRYPLIISMVENKESQVG